MIPGHELPIARYRLTARWRASVHMPDYAGSLLRGQFGAALRQVACMTRQPICSGCALQHTCPYTRIFEAPPPPGHSLQAFSAIPNSYVIEPPPMGATDQRPGDHLTFHLVLAGAAREQLALVVFAWQRALAQGLTRQKVPAELIQVDWIDAGQQPHTVWTADQPIIEQHAASIFLPPTPTDAQALRLQIHTPMRLQQQGKPLRPPQLGVRPLLAALARRTALVLEFHAAQAQWGPHVPAVAALAERVKDARDLHWHDWTRFSSRQQQEMTLGGVLGTWTLAAPSDVLNQLWPWLWLGQWLHVGKNATMGMGGYWLEVQL
jgi:hypothetical protein